MRASLNCAVRTFSIPANLAQFARANVLVSGWAKPRYMYVDYQSSSISHDRSGPSDLVSGFRLAGSGDPTSHTLSLLMHDYTFFSLLHFGSASLAIGRLMVLKIAVNE